MPTPETQARERATILHEKGLHCGEAVLQAVMEARDGTPNALIPKVASCFGAGVGRTKEDLCGALAGGLMAIGCVVGREQAGQGWELAANGGADLRERFMALYGSTRCSEILAAMGPQQNSHLCKRLSGQAAGLAIQVLTDLASSSSEVPGRDGQNAS